MKDKKLERSVSDRKLGGVCGGIGKFFGLDPTLVRVLFAALAVFYGSGLGLYILLWLIIPEENIYSN